METRWYQAGREAHWGGLCEIVTNLGRSGLDFIHHQDYPERSVVMSHTTESLKYLITSGWWTPAFDPELEMDEGL